MRVDFFGGDYWHKITSLYMILGSPQLSGILGAEIRITHEALLFVYLVSPTPAWLDQQDQHGSTRWLTCGPISYTEQKGLRVAVNMFNSRLPDWKMVIHWKQIIHYTHYKDVDSSWRDDYAPEASLCGSTMARSHIRSVCCKVFFLCVGLGDGLGLPPFGEVMCWRK